MQNPAARVNPDWPAAIGRWRVAFDPYGLTQRADGLAAAPQTEDVLQITHHQNHALCIDVGFYRGFYKVCVIQDQDWENPLQVWQSASCAQIKRHLNEAIEKYA